MPVPAPGVAIEPPGAVSAASDGVQVVVRPSAWQGSPSWLPSYVTPFHVMVSNGSPQPLQYDYSDLRLYDEARFQYTALQPAEVAQILRFSGSASLPEARVATAAAGAVVLPVYHRWPYGPFWWDPWWWGPPYPYWPTYPPPPPRLDDIFVLALPVGTVDVGARVEGYVYFPRLRPEASQLVFEFHHRLGGAPRVLKVPFAIERPARG